MKPGWPDSPRVSWWNALWGHFWALPVAIAVASLMLGLLLPVLDFSAELTSGWVFGGGPDGARSVLGTIAGAMISVTGLVFSITIVVLQLASSQFSPRILRSFLESRIVQITLGVFTGSFLYALTVLRAVRGGEDEVVPQTAVTTSYAYVVLAVAMFLAFIHHITTAVQVTYVMADVRRGALKSAARLAAESPAPTTWSPRPATPSVPVHNNDASGYLTTLDGARLVRVARQLDAVVELDLTPGEHVVAGQVLGRIWGADVPDDAHLAVLAAVTLSEERDGGADAGFGIRQLLDIADRALSPGVNDPTTAIQAINELHVVLQAMAQFRDPSPYLVDDGDVVAVYRPQRYARLLQDAVAELAYQARDAPGVVAHLRLVLPELLRVARPEHRAATEAAIEHLG